MTPDRNRHLIYLQPGATSGTAPDAPTNHSHPRDRRAGRSEKVGGPSWGSLHGARDGRKLFLFKMCESTLILTCGTGKFLMLLLTRDARQVENSDYNKTLVVDTVRQCPRQFFLGPNFISSGGDDPPKRSRRFRVCTIFL